MNLYTRMIFAFLMPLALLFGFLHLFIPESNYNFERLHVFLFNLCSGGTIILLYTLNQRKLGVRTGIFLLLSIIFAIVAFLKIYQPAFVIAFILSLIVESIRIQKFSLFPVSFFSSKEPVFRKFHQASLLCLSIGLFLSGLVIINNEFTHTVSLPRLTLDSFFLGFSFPVSLITMSIIFSMVNETGSSTVRGLKEVGFWAVNLGVIVFFAFIVFGFLYPQIFVTITLFCAVIMILFLFYKFSKRMQQKSFLISGLYFLLLSAVSGIVYIFLEIVKLTDYSIMTRILRLHAFFSLYGWNLCGLAVICRFHDFPIRLQSKTIISIHWATIIIAGTLGDYYSSMALLSILGYIIVLYMMFFSKGEGKYPIPEP